MRKRFKTKKKIRLTSLFIFILIVLFTFFSFKIIKNVQPLFLLTGDYHFITLSIDKNDLLLKSGFRILEEEHVQETFKEVEEVVIPRIRKKVYIYNTHQGEEYQDYSVYLAAHDLKNILNDFDIDAIVEETNITEEVKKNNYTYSQSYRVTKDLLSKYLNQDISLFIDLHRDSSNKSVTTVSVDGINYAKIMFVVGGKHESYMENYRVSDALNKMIKNNNDSVSRGLLLRKSSSYNQELGPNIVLIELGGPYNTKDEVLNTLNILAHSIYTYLEE